MHHIFNYGLNRYFVSLVDFNFGFNLYSLKVYFFIFIILKFEVLVRIVISHLSFNPYVNLNFLIINLKKNICNGIGDDKGSTLKYNKIISIKN